LEPERDGGLLPDQHSVNLLLTRLPDADREILARLMAKEVELGVFETLKALEEFQIAPFESGYKGSPFNDFIGRPLIDSGKSFDRVLS
jgi:hypothetical protein